MVCAVGLNRYAIKCQLLESFIIRVAPPHCPKNQLTLNEILRFFDHLKLKGPKSKQVQLKNFRDLDHCKEKHI